MTHAGRLRRHERRAVAAEFRVHDSNDVNAGEITFDALDISESGAFLRSDLLLSEGEALDVSFHLPGRAEPIRAQARIAWAARHGEVKGAPGMGITFTSLGATDRRALADFIGAGQPRRR